MVQHIRTFGEVELVCEVDEKHPMSSWKFDDDRQTFDGEHEYIVSVTEIAL